MKSNLTNAKILRKNDIQNTNISDLLKTPLKSWPNSKYILVIKSQTSKCLKLTLYPIKKNRISKITIFEEKFTHNQVIKIANIIKDLNIIHSSGLTSKEDKFFYECYLDFNLQKTKGFNKTNFENSLEKLKEITKNIKFEEIYLKGGI